MVDQDVVSVWDQEENQRKTPLDDKDSIADAAERRKERDEESGQILTSREDQDPPRRLLSHACSPA